MPELLFECGCEELPAFSVRDAAQQLRDGILSRLTEAGLHHGEAHVYATPRRLIVAVRDVDDRQPDTTKEQRGPGLKAAYDADGNPSPALLGFCRSQGVSPDDLRREGDYVWITKHIPGLPTADLLKTILPDAVRAISFDKTMRWGNSRMRFARPIRWLLAAFGGEPVEFEIEGVRAGLRSRGHRFNHPEEFEARSLEQLLTELRRRDVEPDPRERERRIREGAQQVANGTPLMTDALIEENVYLTEWPSALQAEFRGDFLELPEPVLITAMAKHERFFPIRDADGRLTNRFVSIRNGGVDEVVGAGNAWVLNARFNDAKFFFDEDKKATLGEFLERTKRMTFQEQLGSVRERADRLADLCAKIAQLTGGDEVEQQLAREAGLYAKADLASGLVSELPSLQGVIGGEYARREGMAEAVCHAIAHQYNPAASHNPGDAASRTAARLVIADALDKLAGYLGLGIAPSGSSDPYGLRRAATTLIEAAWSWPGFGNDLGELLHAAVAGYGGSVALDGTRAHQLLGEILESRYRALLAEERFDLVEAAITANLYLPRRVRVRLDAMKRAAADPAFVQTMTRPINIVAAAERKAIAIPGQVQASDLDSEAAAELLTQIAGTRDAAIASLHDERPNEAIDALYRLKDPIDRFFDTTMVMVDDVRVRDARLAMLKTLSDALLQVGDFTKIVIEGGAS